MILVYRPELENPPMDKECSISFSFIGDNGKDNIQVKSGVNRDFPSLIWEKIKGYDVVNNLLKLGALRIETEEATTTAAPESEAADSLAVMPVSQAMTLIEDSFDIEQLNRWDAQESRIRVKNSIAKRISAITEGNG